MAFREIFKRPSLKDPVDAAGVSVPFKYKRVAATSDGIQDIIPAVVGKKFRIVSYSFTIIGTQSLGSYATVEDSSANVLLDLPFPNQGGSNEIGSVESPLMETPTTNTALRLRNPTGIDTYGRITYLEI
jgi:hypothetical protein